MSLNEIVKTMQDAVNRQTDQAKPGGYDTTATVRRIEGDTAFVHIPGGVDETPVKLTINAKAGDNVQVRVSGGNAFLVGNGSAPPTDDARANQAYTVATVAEGAAENALANAARAAEAADSAQASATRAESAAGDAVIAAGDAQTAAGNAQTAADTALVNLATTEDVVGVLNWITAHGTMTTQSGEVFVPGQVYFISDPAGDYVVGGNHYSVVPEPKAADIDSYYILTVNESVQNYVATHIVVDSEGLWIIPDAGGNKVLIATGSGSTYTTAGTYIVGTGNVTLASFTASGAQIGRNDGGNVSIDNNSVDINDGATTLATFGASGAQIGQNANGQTRSVIGTSGMQVVQNVSGSDVPIVNLGYGPASSGSGTNDAPYYTLGKRDSSSPLGVYSIAEGYETSAGAYSHAQNIGTYAGATRQTAIGSYNVKDVPPYTDTFTGDGSTRDFTLTRKYLSQYETPLVYVDGVRVYNFTWTINSGYATFTFTSAPANGSTIEITYYGQFYQGTYLFIVGNGTADNARSNALTVDWSGNVEAAGDIDIASGSTYKVGGVATTERLSTQPNAVSCSNSSWKQVASITMTKGYWIVAYGGAFVSNNTGHRRIHIGTDTSAGRWSPTQQAVQGEQTRMEGVRLIYTTSSSLTWNMYAWQNSGSSLQFYPWIEAIKVMSI